jgi:hypothetical protein
MSIEPLCCCADRLVSARPVNSHLRFGGTSKPFDGEDNLAE